MTGNMSYLLNFKEFNEGYVTFGGGANGGRITGKGTIHTGNLDFEDVYFVKELKFNHFSISQMNNMYSVDMKNIIPKESLTWLVTKDILDESMLWHRRLGKKHKASCKSKILYYSTLFKLHMDLFGTTYAEAINTACYVQNRALVVKLHNKTPYELFRGRTPAISFMKPFGFHVTILNTLDHLGKFDDKADEGYFVRYSMTSKAFR
nr:ribonuclease H-like domain-containing protein [Tanacetum cinerariifolium]